MLKGFRAFIARGNVIDLAVAVVIGAAFATVVKSFVDDMLMPPLGLALGRADFTDLYVVLKNGVKPPPYASLLEAKAAGAVTMNYGVFINTLVAFLIVAFAVYVLMRWASRFNRPVAAGALETKPCPVCTMTIPLAAKRCPQCTSQLVP